MCVWLCLSSLRTPGVGTRAVLPSRPARWEGSLDLSRTRSSTLQGVAGKPARPLGDRKSFLPWPHCVIYACVSSHCPRCQVFFVANPELLKTASCVVLLPADRTSAAFYALLKIWGSFPIFHCILLKKDILF